MAGRRKDFGQRKDVGHAKETADVENNNNGELTATSSDVESDWKQDLPSIVLLLILYTLQGIPMGLSGSIPFLLLEKVIIQSHQARLPSPFALLSVYSCCSIHIVYACRILLRSTRYYAK